MKHQTIMTQTNQQFQSLLDLVPSFEQLQVYPVFRYVESTPSAPFYTNFEKQRNHVPYDQNSVLEMKNLYSVFIQKKKEFIKMRILQKIQEECPFKQKIPLGHFEKEEYYNIFTGENLGKIRCTKKKVRLDGEFRETNVIRHTFTEKSHPSCEFLLKKYYERVVPFKKKFETCHRYTFQVKQFKFIYYPEFLTAECSFEINYSTDPIQRPLNSIE